MSLTGPVTYANGINWLSSTGTDAPNANPTTMTTTDNTTGVVFNGIPIISDRYMPPNMITVIPGALTYQTALDMYKQFMAPLNVESARKPKDEPLPEPTEFERAFEFDE